MSAEAGQPSTAPQRRGPNRAGLLRREQIVREAGQAFAERGFHGAGVEEIAAAAGVSGPALYRHFPSKYALFAECARSLAQGLLDAWPAEPPGDPDPDGAKEHLVEVFAVLSRVTLANRRSGGIYRWEGRYLEPTDREVVRSLFEEMITRVADQVRVIRPTLDGADLDLVSAGALSVLASLTSHRTAMPVGRVVETMADAALRVVGTALVPAGDAGAQASTAKRGVPRRSRRAEVLAASLHLFYAEGYAEVTIEAIASEVGLTTSGFYRHFASKAEVLLAACLLASDRLDAAVEAAELGSGTAHESVRRLVGAYVAHSFSHKEQMAVYDAHVTSLPDADQARLRALQRDHVALWVAVLQDARPELDASAARFLVMAAISTVTDLGRRLRWRDDAATLERVSAVIEQALGVGVEA